MARGTKRAYQLGDWWIAQRGDTYYRYRYKPGKRDVERVSLGTKDFEDAKDRLTSWFMASEKPAVKPSSLTLAECLVRYWLRHAQHTPSARTIKPQLAYWNDHFGDVTVMDGVTYDALEDFRDTLRERGLAPSTINHTLMCGRAAMRMAWKRGELPSVPFVESVKVGEQEPKGRPLSIDEMRTVLSVTEGHLHTLLVFLIGTAARPGALYDLDYKQFDRDMGLLHLNPVGRPQSKKWRPTVRLPRQLAAYEGKGPVIAWDGEAVGTCVASWRKARARAGLDGRANLYSFRTTTSRWMLSRGVPLDEVKLQLGHRNLGVTGTYLGFEPDYLRRACEAIEGLLDRVGVTKP